MQTFLQDLQFEYPLKMQRVSNCTIVTETIGHFTVTAKAYVNEDANPVDTAARYHIDLDSVLYNGKDIMPVVDYFEHREDIEIAAKRHLKTAITEKGAAA